MDDYWAAHWGDCWVEQMAQPTVGLWDHHLVVWRAASWAAWKAVSKAVR